MDQDQALISWPEEGVTRAPFKVYSDPAGYDAEMTRIFRGPIWHHLGLEIEIPDTGDRTDERKSMGKFLNRGRPYTGLEETASLARRPPL
jgi:hypothetical protein